MNVLKRALEGLRRAHHRLETRLVTVRTSLGRAARRVDPRDLAVFGGLALLANGVRMIYTPASWIIVGGFFMWISLRRAR